ncbi:MAG: imidazoleglycerol-phosphate dehydratase HisB [Acidobacteriota bacterium]
MAEPVRKGEIQRKTSETEVFVSFELDGIGNYQIDTEIPFLGHMLSLFTMHSLTNLTITARGDINVDYHHTVEDIGICLGQTLGQAVGDKKGINRYGSALVPMDEALAQVVIDMSGRSFIDFNVDFPTETIGNFPTELFEEFFRAVASNAGMTLHIDVLKGTNSHHMIEAVFKALGRALQVACSIDPKMDGVWSTKGKL